MKRTFALVILTALSVFAAMSELSPQEAYARQKAGALVIDVRTPQEYFYIGHAPGHINVPYYFEQFSMEDTGKRELFSTIESKLSHAITPKSVFKVQQLPNDDFAVEVLRLVKNDKDREIILICKAGERSKAAGHMLEDKGFSHLYSVTNGFEGKKKEKNNGWMNSDLPWGQ